MPGTIDTANMKGWRKQFNMQTSQGKFNVRFKKHGFSFQFSFNVIFDLITRNWKFKFFAL